MKTLLLTTALIAFVFCLSLQPLVNAQPNVKVPKLFKNSATAFNFSDNAKSCSYTCKRRSVKTWSRDDWALYGQLMVEANKRKYIEQLIGAHSLDKEDDGISMDFHGSKAFLTWHRFFITHFEQLLQKIDHEINKNRAKRDGEFCLGYWDWGFKGEYSTSFVDQAYRYVFNSRAIGTLKSTRREAPIPDSPFKNFELPDPIGRVVRWPERDNDGNRSNNWAPSQVAACVAIHDYEEPGTSGSADDSSTNENLGFRACLEYNVHGMVHASIDGTMAHISISPSDPAFWIHHTMVDYLFYVWQQNSKSRYPRDFNTNIPAPYDKWTFNNAKEWGRFCFDYEDDTDDEDDRRKYSKRALLQADQKRASSDNKFTKLDRSRQKAVTKLLTTGETKAQPQDKLSFLKDMSKNSQHFDKIYKDYVKYVYYAQVKYQQVSDAYAKDFEKATNQKAKPSSVEAKQTFKDQSAPKANARSAVRADSTNDKVSSSASSKEDSADIVDVLA